jgi:hypothetical protein
MQEEERNKKHFKVQFYTINSHIFFLHIPDVLPHRKTFPHKIMQFPIATGLFLCLSSGYVPNLNNGKHDLILSIE